MHDMANSSRKKARKLQDAKKAKAAEKEKTAKKVKPAKEKPIKYTATAKLTSRLGMPGSYIMITFLNVKNTTRKPKRH